MCNNNNDLHDSCPKVTDNLGLISKQNNHLQFREGLFVYLFIYFGRLYTLFRIYASGILS